MAQMNRDVSMNRDIHQALLIILKTEDPLDVQL